MVWVKDICPDIKVSFKFMFPAIMWCFSRCIVLTRFEILPMKRPMLSYIGLEDLEFSWHISICIMTERHVIRVFVRDFLWFAF